MLKSIGVSLLAIGVMGSATASAQSFSFEATRGEVTSLGGIGPQGSLYSGAHWNGTYTATFEGEKSKNGAFDCAATAQPPGLFAMHIACTMTQDDGSFTSSWGCNPLSSAQSEMICVAGLYGRSGRFEGLSGGATSHQKDNISSGVGQFVKPGE